MKRSRAILSLALAASLVFATAVQAFSAVPSAEVPFFAENASNEAILSEMALHPAAVRRGTVTYMAYQGPGYDPYVVSYDDATGEWSGPHRVGTNPLVLDAHGAPALYFDASDRLHVLYGGHGLRLFHARAAAPGVIDSWVDLPYIDTYGTYPQVMDASDGRVLLFYRSLGHDWVVRESDEAREIFGEAETVLKAGADTWWYADFKPGTDGDVHAAFVWVDNEARLAGGTLGRRNAYYMRRDVSGEWQTATGTPIPTLPVTRQVADEMLRIYDSQGAGTNEITVKEDSSGAPCVLFITGTGAGKDAYTWMYARSSEDTWTFTPITTADHTFDSGAFLPGEDGFVEALLVAGYSGAVGTTDLDPRGRGGAIERWTSNDYGKTWARDTRITPGENGTAFADPQWVIGGEGPARAIFVEWVTDPSNFFNRMFLWGDEGLVSRRVTPTVERLAGPERAQTAVEISKLGFPEGATTVVLATQKDFPDALAGVPLAHRLNAPLLLTATDALSTGVAQEIRRLGAAKVVLLGGTNALAPSIEAELLANGVKTIERVSGESRYDTALEISRRMYDPTDGVTTAVLVSGQNWPDAATAAPLAAVMGAPILLTMGDTLSPQAADALAEWGTKETLVIGGTAVISAAVESAVPSPERLAGASRYETSVAVARAGLELNYLPYRVLLATGAKFPDALAGAALASRLRAPVLLTQPEVLPAAARDYYAEHTGTITRSFIIGNTAAVSSAVEKVIGKQGATD